MKNAGNGNCPLSRIEETRCRSCFMRFIPGSSRPVPAGSLALCSPKAFTRPIHSPFTVRLLSFVLRPCFFIYSPPYFITTPIRFVIRFVPNSLHVTFFFNHEYRGFIPPVVAFLLWVISSRTHARLVVGCMCVL